MISIVILYAVSASTFMISKILLMYCTPLALTGLRTFIAGLIFFAYLKHRKTIISYKHYLIPCLAIGFFSFYLSNTLKFWAVAQLSSQRSACIALSEPFFTVCFAYLLCGELMTRRSFAGVLLCLMGSYAAVVGLHMPLRFSMPECIMLISVCSSTFGALLMRKYIRINGYCATTINCLSMAMAGVAALLTAGMIEYPGEKIVDSPGLIFAVLLLVMIGVSNIFAYSLYGKLVVRYSAILISCVSLLRPFFVAFYSGQLNALGLWSGGIVLLGLYVIYHEQKRLLPVSYEMSKVSND